MSDSSDSASTAEVERTRRSVLRLLEFEDIEEESDAVYFQPGDSIGPFQVIREIGRGGMGVVYLANDEERQLQVALKLLPLSPLDQTPERMHRVEREGRILDVLDHPSIVSVHATGTLMGFRYVAMDYVEGTNLRDLIRLQKAGFAKPGDPGWMPFVLNLLYQVADALAAAHERGVIHRDIKPENVLVNQNGQPVLVDFGLAREDHSSGATITQGFVGTPRYASPEQARGETLTVGSDVFSFGVLAFEAITEKVPFEGKTTQELLEAIQENQPKWPQGAQIPTHLRLVISKCLEKNVRHRYPNARAIAEDLERFLKFQRVAALQDQPWFARWSAPESKRLLGVLALVTLLAVFGWSYAWWSSQSLRTFKEQGWVKDTRLLLQDGRIAEARKEVLEYTSSAGNSDPAFALLGDIELWTRDWTAAVEAYSQLEHPSVTDNLGLALAKYRQTEGVNDLPDILLTPLVARDFYLLSTAQHLRGKMEEAIQTVSAGIEKYPGHYLLHKLRAAQKLESGLKSEAVLDLQIMQTVQPDDIETKRHLGWAWHDLGELQSQESLLRGALRLQSGEDSDLLIDTKNLVSKIVSGNNPLPYSLQECALLLADLGLALYPRERRSTGIEIAKEALRLDPSHVWIHCSLARNLIWYREYDKARSVIDVALQEFPEAREILIEKARLEVVGGDRDAGHRLVRELLSESIWLEKLTLLDIEAQYYFSLNTEDGFENSYLAYAELIRLDPQSSQWHFHAAKCLEKLGRDREAKDLYEQAVTLNPQRAEYRFPFAKALDHQGEDTKALDMYYQAYALNPDDKVTVYWIARVWLELEQPGPALFYATEATKHYPTWSYAWVLRASCEWNLHSLDAAEISYRKALEIGVVEGHAFIRADYGDVLFRLGKEKEALEQFQQAQRIDHECVTAIAGEAIVRLRATEESGLLDAERALELLVIACEKEPKNREYSAFKKEAEELLQISNSSGKQ